MYGYKLRMLVWGIIALLGATYLTFFSGEPSWSQNAGTSLHFFLNLVLLSIADTFGEIASNHPQKKIQLYKWLNVSIRLSHLANFTKYSFYAILVFHLSHEYMPEIFHMLATGLGVLGLYLQMITYFKTWSKKYWLSLVLINVSALMLILAFGFKLFEVGYGELALAISGITYQLLMNKSWKKQQ